jgi:hypothetical protein
MPVSTFTIAANADDGVAWSWQTITGSGVAYAGGPTVSGRAKTYLTFGGITIANGAEINSATLSIYTSRYGGTGSGVVFLRHKSNPPTGVPPVSSVIGASTEPTITLGPPDVLTTTEKFTSPTPGTTSPSAGDYTQKLLDVKDMVQSLVSEYDYSSGNMMFIVSALGNGELNVYMRDAGLTKVAQLTIDYTAGSSLEPDKTSYRYG